MLRPLQSAPGSTVELAQRSNTDTTERTCFTTRPNCCQSLPAAARPAQVELGNIAMLGSSRILPPRHQRGIAVSIADRYRHCGTGRACSVFVPRRILDIKYYVFISDPGNFHVCMSVDAIPVLAPCGDRLKKGRRGAKERGPGDTKGALSYRGAFNKPECGQAQALEFCLSGQVGSASASAGQPSFSRPRSSSRSGERSLLFFFIFYFSTSIFFLFGA